jgi:hypothetical protein
MATLSPLKSKDDKEQSDYDREFERIVAEERARDKAESRRGLFRPEESTDTSRARQVANSIRNWFGSGKSKRKKQAAIAGGIGGVAGVFVMILGLIFNFLGGLRMDFVDQNIQETRLARMYYIFDQRSDQFLVQMLSAEIAGREAGESRYFRARAWGVDHPFTGWYRDMRLDGFFDELARQEGVTFVRETGNNPSGEDRLVRIQFANGTELDFRDINREIRSGGGISPDRLDTQVKEIFQDNKSARRAWYTTVKNNTRRHQIIKRRHLRKWGRDTLGINKWQFFENKRENTRRRVRNAWTKAVGKRFLEGGFFNCLLSNTDCPDSDNINDSDNHLSGSIDPDAEEAIDETSDEEAEARENGGTSGDIDVPEGEVDLTRGGRAGRFTRRIAQKFISKVIPVANILEWFDLLKNVDNLVGDGTLVRMVTISRATEYALAFATFQTMTHQIKEGESVSPEEADEALQMFAGAEYSDGWQSVVQDQEQRSAGGNSAPIARLLKSKLQRSTSVVAQEPGSGSRDSTIGDLRQDDEGETGDTIQDQRNNDAASTDPGSTIADTRNRDREYDEVKEEMKVNSDDSNAARLTDIYNSTIGIIIGPIVDLYEATPLDEIVRIIADGVGAITGYATDVIVDALEAIIPGLDINRFLQDVGATILEWLGIVPNCPGEAEGGRLMNCVVGGADVTQEYGLQSMGAGPISDATAAQLKQEIIEEKDAQLAQTSWRERLFSRDNPNSLLAQVVIRTPSSPKGLFRSSQKQLAEVTSGKLFTKTASQLLSPKGSYNQRAYAALDENLFALDYYGLTASELAAHPFGGQTQRDCDCEIATFQEAVQRGEDPATSICSIDQVVANSLHSKYSTEDDGGLGEGGGGSDDGSISPDLPQGTAQELAGQILANANITFDSNSIRTSFVQVSEDGTAGTHSNGGSRVQVSARLMAVILKLAESTPIRISSLTTGGHSATSNHYVGTAVDIGNEEVAGQIVPALYTNRAAWSINELIFSPMPAGTTTLKNGNNHVYSSDTLSDHRNHIHFSVQ